ncbi:hypothetical protein F5050DRAFT_614843 [Lentinula boryana]|uniref:Uncharacterized protein n=1 Tax=Lentinula boryana TaxID=40481 RepID=A0ABQ8Q5X6_9AGAR|nr:hypothetical protein F5050DRAFT_614843 [Lentinula boryana]
MFVGKRKNKGGPCNTFTSSIVALLLYSGARISSFLLPCLFMVLTAAHNKICSRRSHSTADKNFVHGPFYYIEIFSTTVQVQYIMLRSKTVPNSKSNQRTANLLCEAHRDCSNTMTG